MKFSKSKVGNIFGGVYLLIGLLAWIMAFIVESRLGIYLVPQAVDDVQSFNFSGSFILNISVLWIFILIFILKPLLDPVANSSTLENISMIATLIAILLNTVTLYLIGSGIEKLYRKIKNKSPINP